MKSLVIGAVLATLVFGVALFTGAGIAYADPVNLSILYTGDTQGHLTSFYYESTKPIGGIAKRAIFFQDKRRFNDYNWLTLDAGDAFTGTPLSDVYQGYLDIAAMNKLKYDAMVLGVHEFDYGVDVLLQRVSEAEFPVLAANVTYADTGAYFVEPYTIIDRGGLKVAVIGLTTGELSQRVAPANFANLTVSDPIETARRLVPQLRTQADIIVALTHLGIDEDIRLSGEVQDIDVIVGGMSHSELQSPFKVGRALIVHSAEYGCFVGMLKLSVDRDTSGRFERRWFDCILEPMAGKWVENSDYVSWLDGFRAQMVEHMNVILGQSAVQMTGAKVRSSETMIGNYICDTLRMETGADICLLPAMFFQGDLPKGAVTLGDLYRVMPYSHHAVVMTVNGGELKDILNDAASQIGKAGFPQVSGCTFSIYRGNAEQITIADQPLDPFKSYTIVTSEGLATGGMGYATLGTITDRRYIGKSIRDIVKRSLSSGTMANSRIYGRIAFLAHDPALLASAQPPAGGNTTPPESSQPMEQPAGDTPATDYTPPERTDEPAGSRPIEDNNDTTPPSDMNTQRHDRNGRPIIEDEVITDAGSELETTEEPVQPTQPVTAPPEVTETPATEPELPAYDRAYTGDRILGQSMDTQNNLEYVYILIEKERTYEFQLKVTNISASEVKLNYPTEERFDFLAYDGNDLVWNRNHGRFFVQSSQSDTLAPGESLTFKQEWSRHDNNLDPVGSGLYRFEAVHNLDSSQVRLRFDADLPR